jgi:lambda family phage portal protein
VPRRKPTHQSVQAKYEAAGNSRRVAKWQPTSSGPIRATAGLQKIRDRSQDAVRNDWAGSGTVQKWTTTLVGTGIVTRWKNRKFEPLYRRWARDADADGVLDLYGLQALAVRTWFGGGECFIRERPRPLGAPLAAPVQVQLLEPEMCPLLDATAWPGLPEGHEIRQGIEINRYGRRVAYWFYKAHPGDGLMNARQARPDELVRVAASMVRHMFEVKRPGQLRGVPELAGVLARIRSSADFEDNVLDRQKLANLFTMFITRQLPDKFLNDLELNPLTGLPAMWDDTGNMMATLEPGSSMELRPGEGVQFANPPEAGTTYSEYMRTLHMGTATGSGMPYELLSGDIKDVSDRTMRVVINEFRRFAEQRQWHTIIPNMVQPCVEWWADAMVLSGQLTAAEAAEAKDTCRHSPHGWEYIHPVQDVEGKLKAIEGGLTSRDAEIARRGDDPVVVDEERAESAKRQARLMPAPPAPAPAPAPAPQAQLPAPAAQAPALDPVRMVESLSAFVSAMRPEDRADPSALAKIVADATVAIVAGLPPPQPVNIQNHTHVQPTPVNVEVAAPTIENHTHVQPTPVNVEVTPEVKVDLGTRKTTTDISRDGSGEIIKVVQIEKSVD